MTATETIGSGAEPEDVEPADCIRTVAFDDWRAALELRGELDLASVDMVRTELVKHLDAGRRVLRVDASALTFIDSTIVGVLVETNHRCHAEQGSLILTGVPPRVQRILAISGLDQVLLVDNADGQ